MSTFGSMEVQFGDIPRNFMLLEPEGEYDEALVEEGTMPCGWVPEELANDDDKELLEQTPQLEMFELIGGAAHTPQSRKVELYAARNIIAERKGWSRPPYVNQSTGSCVGAGDCNALLTLRDFEIVVGNENEEPDPIWWPYAYGEGREKAGMTRRGSGSFGRAQAWAVSTKGNLSCADASLELPVYRGWYRLPKDTELEWSDGDRREADRYDTDAAKHTCKMTRVSSAEDGATAIQNGYTMTVACRFGTRGTKVKGGDFPVRIAEWDASWAHQQSVLGWWDHPSLGELFFIMNQWHDRHGKPVDGSPHGGYWVLKSTFQRMCRTGEVFAKSLFNGFPGRDDEMKRLAEFFLF